MSNEIQVFRNHEINAAIRTIIRDGEPWFVSVDVCTALGFANPRQAVATHTDSDERGVHLLDTPSSQQQMSCVSEAGVYRLIFRSRKPEAKAFQRWVTHEVLPSIRKTGTYSLGTPRTYAQALRAAADAAEALEAAEIAATNAKAQAAAAQAKTQAVIAYAKPRVDFAHRVARTTDEHTITEAAKLLGVSRTHLLAVLTRRHILYWSNGRHLPYQQHVKNGNFRMRIIEKDYGTYSQPVVTRKGLARISSLLGRV